MSASAEERAPDGVLVDTSAWIWHFRSQDPAVEHLISQALALGHIDVAGEVSMGHSPHATRLRDRILALRRLEAIDRLDLLSAVEEWGITGRGIGWVDAGLLAACRASPVRVSLYTRDRRMAAAASIIGVAVWLPPEAPGWVS